MQSHLLNSRQFGCPPTFVLDRRGVKGENTDGTPRRHSSQILIGNHQRRYRKDESSDKW